MADDRHTELPTRQSAPPVHAAPVPSWMAVDQGPPDNEPPGPSEHLGIKWVARFFKLAGYLSALMLLRELVAMRRAGATDSVTVLMIAHAVITAAAATGFLQTAKQLLERRKSGGIMAAIGCSLLIANSLRPTLDALPVAMGAAGLIILASVWKKLDE